MSCRWRPLPLPLALAGRRALSLAAAPRDEERVRLLVVGGGSGGCAMAAKCSRVMQPGEVAVLEPADTHYYQPLFTLVGGGLSRLADARRPMGRVLPKRARWVKDEAALLRPDDNLVETAGGRRIRYDFLLLAAGLELRYQDVPGLTEALQTPGSGVASNYSPCYVEKTAKEVAAFQGGRALFTFPDTPVKCAGAPQKIMYLVEERLRLTGRREAAVVEYHTALPALFGVPHYADALWPIVRKRGIDVSLRSELVEVRPDKREAVFRSLDSPEQTQTLEYSFLHATPPQGPPPIVKACKELADPKSGFLAVDKYTLRSVTYPNVFGIGDCTNLPTSKTAAAVAAQCGVLRCVMRAIIKGNQPPAHARYDGYTSCPLVTGQKRCVLAEFDYEGRPLETFPMNQAYERRSMYMMKSKVMPLVYWNLMLRGYWEGPRLMRKVLHLGMCR